MLFYNNIDIQFYVGGCKFHAVNLSVAEIKNNIPLHSHGVNCYELHYISEGCGTLKADGVKYDITPNTLFVTGPLVEHSQLTDTKSPMREWCIYLRTDESDTGKYDKIISEFLSKTFWIGQDEHQLLPLFQRLFSELENRFDGYKNMAGLLISEIIVSAARNYIKKPVRTGEIDSCVSERISLIIEQYFLYEYRTASLEELSARLGLSPRQTQRVIEKYYSSSFQKKKNEAKMSAAAILLLDASLSLSDVAERLGYSSQEYFTAAFKKHYNISPGNFRKNNFRKL